MHEGTISLNTIAEMATHFIAYRIANSIVESIWLTMAVYSNTEVRIRGDSS